MLTTAHYPLFISLIKRISDNFKIRIINRLAHRVKIFFAKITIHRIIKMEYHPGYE